MRKQTALVVLIFLALTSSVAWAGDRILEVQSRVSAAMGNILEKNEYLVVVNRIDSLDAMGGQAVTGNVRSLPGLRVGVDEEGQVVVKEGQQAAYSGPVSVTVVIDNGVEMETYRAIEALLPEIMGGARGGDEIKLKRAVLKQPLEEEAPQVVINNAPPQIDPKQVSGNSDFYKLAVLFFFGLGALLWALSRGSEGKSDRKRPLPESVGGGRESEKSSSGAAWNPATLDSMDPEILGLYLLKCVHDRDLSRARSFLKAASPQAQRNALATLPAWCSSYCLEQVDPKDRPEGKVEEETHSPESVMRELTVLERSLKDDPTTRATVLIQWIPLEAMSRVHPESLVSPSDSTRFAVISLRPDLARSFYYDENDALVSGMVFNAKAIVEAAKELQSWKTRIVVTQNAKTSVVEAMAGIVNRTNSFDEIDSKLKNIQKKMSKIDWQSLQEKIVSRETFYNMNDLQKKDFLRRIDPNDFYCLVAQLNECGDWNLEALLRPKRLAAFKNADTEAIHLSWKDEEIKDALLRALNHLRATVLGEKPSGETSSAA